LTIVLAQEHKRPPSLVKIFQLILFIDLSRYCIPTDKNLSEALLNKVASGDLGRYMTDLSICWWVFLVLGGISAVLGFVYLVLLRWFAKPIIYLSMVAIIGLMIGGGFYVFFLGNKYD
jgi:hypothetical protein